jgi:fumarate reductase flavoprotein subunit
VSDARVAGIDALDAAAPQVPALIIGAGACGLVAAIVLRDAGIDCVLLERDATPGGSTALSSGFLAAAGTRVQRAAGVRDDSPVLFGADIQAKAGGAAAAKLVAAYTQAIGPALDRLDGRAGLELQLLDGFLYPGHSRRRMHAVPERTGAALLQRLLRCAEASGATLLADARAVDLHVDREQRIAGVSFERPDGSREQIRCDALLLACNGFGGDPALVSELLPALAAAPFAGHVGNDGSALRWGRQLGAALADLDAAQGHGSWAVPHGLLVSWALMAEGGVQVNARGERFHDESRGYSEAAVDVLTQPAGIAWCVYDAPLARLGDGFAELRAARSAGAIREAGDLHALAALIGCDAAVLAATFDEITASARERRADRFGRVHRREWIAPFHAVRVTGALFHTQGGLDVDPACRVRGADGSPLPNLWAAGGAARGVSGRGLGGYLSGNGLLSAVAGGWIAAQAIAAAR